MQNDSQTKISRRRLILGGAAGIGGAIFDPHRAGEARRISPINLLFINTDQQRFDALSCAGNPDLATPSLDRLARSGVRFERAFTPCPVCVPARTSFATGLTIHTSGYTDNTKINDTSLNVGSGSFDQLLSSAGYRAEYHGRYHASTKLLDCYKNDVSPDFIKPYKRHLVEALGQPPEPGEGQYRDYLSDWPYRPDSIDYQLRSSRGNAPRHGVSGIAYGVSTLPPAYSYSAFVADRAIDALGRLKDRPFAITVALLHPHHPQYVSPAFAGKADPRRIREPLTLRSRRENTPYGETPWQMDEFDIRHVGLIRARYYELVQEVDHHIGRILDRLDRLGLDDNTLVIFTSDHGEMLGDHGLTQKFVPYQSSIRVPLIMRLPGKIPKSLVVIHPVNTLDLTSTICDYLGISPPAQEGRSLRPLVEGKDPGRSPYTFSEFDFGTEKYVLFVSAAWKLVWTRDKAQVDMLYNLERDPHETTNLIGQNPDRAKFIPKAEEIRREILAWMEEIRHPFRDILAKAEIG